ILRISSNATTEEVREAYKREALRTHPDRTTNIEGEPPLSQREATTRFQEVADAYYVLSNSERRKQYDDVRRSHSNSTRSSYSTSASHAEPNSVFGGVFEELLRPEVENPSNFYSPIGMGAYGGKKLGHIRDIKGVPVADVFMRLEHAHKAAIIAAIATKIFKSVE
ncbi:hypothetical protein BGZ76_002099, partial [Entomortierella beljakovae]